MSARPLTIQTAGGDVRCEQFGEPERQAVIWVFGAGGGFGGPAGGLYTRLAERLAQDGIASLCIDYRYPGKLEPCTADVVAGADHLAAQGVSEVIFVGHSFGGAVVIRSALARPEAIGVAALSSQTHGTEGVERLAPRPLLLIHGEEDEILPAMCSADIYSRARRPKKLIVYPGCLHGLDQCIEKLDTDLY